jgi:phosphoadenosine phosphosulfate reductase
MKWYANCKEREKKDISRRKVYMHVTKALCLLEQLNSSQCEVAFSGGKDSLVLYDLCKQISNKWNFVHNMTGLDAPETMKYIHSFPNVQVRIGSFFKLVEKKGFPTRVGRWCCAALKHRRGEWDTVLTGIRKEESRVRKVRNIIEADKARKRYPYVLIHPLIEWTEKDIWEYIEERNLSINPLYESRGRIGCLFCPYQSVKLRSLDAIAYPKHKQALIKAFDKRIAYVRDRGLKPLTFKDGNELFDWWISK